MLKADALQAIRNPHQIRVLLLLRDRGPMRFNEMQRALGINPAQLDRALTVLVRGVWVLATTIPGTLRGNTIALRYSLGANGKQLLKAFDAFVASLRRAAQREWRVVDELDALYPA